MAKNDVRIIKKYPNRRLYDTKINAYITLADVKKLVIDHIKFKVIDAKTETDLTQMTLLQIMIEEENSPAALFTTESLEQFIRFYHDHSQPLLRQYLEQMLSLFAEQKAFLMEQWQRSQSFLLNPKTLNVFTDLQKKWFETFFEHKTDKDKK